MNNSTTQVRGNRILSWIIRVFLLLVIAFFMLFSLDVFSEGQSLGKTLLAFLVHNIPAFVLIIILVIGWKYEHIAGGLLILASIAMVLLFGGPSGLMYGTWIMISLPFITGVLFLCNYYFFGNNSA